MSVSCNTKYLNAPCVRQYRATPNMTGNLVIRRKQVGSDCTVERRSGNGTEE
ncbi:hypothetical protein Huta_2706 [Halorhabdus utahensis DSM 12940]|uniref:Uncharacterized protein n=1 Tax=Halorhabdus utahensis (strain DSM 12940 / JCM 11049 / AX-2) TaxID=519442 RepID=C7NQE1_HALUD|nr:hypothetical protein Huta_2706 [Halorhabdus utahensis DSM 12940]